jgi:hypothetical protein
MQCRSTIFITQDRFLRVMNFSCFFLYIFTFIICFIRTQCRRQCFNRKYYTKVTFANSISYSKCDSKVLRLPTSFVRNLLLIRKTSEDCANNCIIALKFITSNHRNSCIKNLILITNAKLSLFESSLLFHFSFCTKWSAVRQLSMRHLIFSSINASATSKS